VSRNNSQSSSLYKIHLNWLRTKKEALERQQARVSKRMEQVVVSHKGKLPAVYIEALLMRYHETAQALNLYTDILVQFQCLAQKLDTVKGKKTRRSCSNRPNLSSSEVSQSQSIQQTLCLQSQSGLLDSLDSNDQSGTCLPE